MGNDVFYLAFAKSPIRRTWCFNWLPTKSYKLFCCYLGNSCFDWLPPKGKSTKAQNISSL